jgi:hypothetical protein
MINILLMNLIALKTPFILLAYLLFLDTCLYFKLNPYVGGKINKTAMLLFVR